ncbi:MAG: SAM-dependent methyltransferase, partial [Myxococcota bacterium]|nr:SAM-dependent methyltransferase [Myxococcota bacterium]
MTTGSLTIVGLGPARPENITTEALSVLRCSQQENMRVYALQHARDMAWSVVPDLKIRSLDYLYHLPDVDRPTAYRDLAQMMLRKAFDEGEQVVYLVAGSPLFYNDVVLLIRKMAAKKERSVRLVHGMSFVDLVLDQVYWTG